MSPPPVAAVWVVSSVQLSLPGVGRLTPGVTTAGVFLHAVLPSLNHTAPTIHTNQTTTHTHPGFLFPDITRVGEGEGVSPSSAVCSHPLAGVNKEIEKLIDRLVRHPTTTQFVWL